MNKSIQKTKRKKRVLSVSNAKQDNKSGLNYRVAGVILLYNNVLLQKKKNDKFWALPGGRVELFEVSTKAITREIFEELGITVTPQNLFCINENFFTFNNQNVHEISLFYQVQLTRTFKGWFTKNNFVFSGEPFKGIEKDKDIIFKWFPISELSKDMIRPNFIVDLLQNNDFSFKHVISND